LPPAVSTDRELLLELGAAALAAGRPVHEVEGEVRCLGATLGAPDTRAAATPTGIFVSLGAGEPVGFASTGALVRLDQAARLEQITDALLEGRLGADAALSAVRGALAAPPRLSRPIVALALLPQAVGVALVLQPTIASALAAFVAALVVVALDLLADRARMLRVLLPVLAAFGAGCVVFAAHRVGWLDAPLRTALAPVAVLLPGALIVTGMSEVAAGAMVAGAARLTFGAVQVLLLSFGLFLAARVLGVAPDELANTRLDELGWPATLAGVLLVGAGVYVHLSAPRGVLPWMLAILLLTGAVQGIGQQADGPALGGFAGGVVAALASAAVHHRPGGPPQLAVFLPAFWLLVPGSLGVLSATALATAGSSAFAATLDAVASIITISLGVLVGAALGAILEPRSRFPASATVERGPA
jgi:uncharacterized membrane protein YjjP (DUF1212 family)